MTQLATNSSQLESAVSDLRKGSRVLVDWPIEKRRSVAAACVRSVAASSREWVEAACSAKRIPAGNKARAEEITGGPLATVRQLQLLVAVYHDIELYNEPMLPGRVSFDHGQLRTPIFPTRQLFDSLLFGPIKAETWLEPEVAKDDLFDPAIDGMNSPGTAAPRIACVLGAGNVSSIPATDTLTKVFQENKAVLLKVNPVNEYIGGIFERALSPLIDASVLRIIYGDAGIGSQAIRHKDVDEVHITGSTNTHDAIVWGATDAERKRNRAANTPVLTKRITSELGNVTPWVVVPGEYSERQLRFQAANIAASITNNASFNCIATKLIVTSRQWPQRERFLSLIEQLLRQTPARYAYYPGAAERFESFAECKPDDRDYLPWTIRRNIDLDAQHHMLAEESFVCVCGEIALEADSAKEFLQKAVALVNEQVWGTLAASLTVPKKLQRSDDVDAAVRTLRYGTIGVNQWAAVGFALMSPPWGAFAGSTLDDVQSGIGFVHNTFMLNRPQKTVLRSPLTIFPRPIWFNSHRCPEQLGWRLLDLYAAPSVWRIPALLGNALQG